MARYLQQIISLSEISSDFSYACRYPAKDPALEKSVAARGLCQPLIVTGDSPNKILAGHKRFEALKKSGCAAVEVLVLQAPLPEPERFLFAVLSNWNQKMSEMDMAWTLFRAAKVFHLPETVIREEIFPALGLQAVPGFYEESLEVMGLDASLLDLIAGNQMPFRGARVLRRFSGEDQKQFASRVASRVSLTTNQLLKLGDWLGDLMKSSSLNLEKLLQRQGWESVLSAETDRRNKAERFFEAVRAARFPHLLEKEKQFTALSSQFRESDRGITVEAPSSFEAEGLILKARIRDAEALDHLRETLEQKRKILNSLLDIVL